MDTSRSSRPVITAPNMLTAQSVRLSPEVKAYLVERADRIRNLLGDSDPVTVALEVVDYDGARIGSMTYTR